MIETPLSWWITFNAAVLALLAMDLFVFHRQPKAMSLRSASVMSLVWVLLSLSFCAWIWHTCGSKSGMEFLTGYLVEYSLSVDNIFVFVMLFSFFRVPAEHQYRVLFWGVLGAIIMRGALIGVGVMLVQRFHWVLYIFGAFLVFTGLKMLLSKQDELAEPSNNSVLRLLRRCLPLSNEYHGKNFMVRQGGRWMFTPLAVVLVMVETTDLIFALDSIPAIFAITQDPFLVYSSNICAILGLRALYFVLAGCVHEFIFLKAGLSIVLTFIGCRMLSEPFFHIPTPVALGIVGAILTTSIVTSIAVKRWNARRSSSSGSETQPPS
jgi:tellurite resistance protein TerC